LLRIFILQLLRGDFFNTIGTKRTYRDSLLFVRLPRSSSRQGQSDKVLSHINLTLAVQASSAESSQIAKPLSGGCPDDRGANNANGE